MKKLTWRNALLSAALVFSLFLNIVQLRHVAEIHWRPVPILVKDTDTIRMPAVTIIKWHIKHCRADTVLLPGTIRRVTFVCPTRKCVPLGKGISEIK